MHPDAEHVDAILEQPAFQVGIPLLPAVVVRGQVRLLTLRVPQEQHHHGVGATERADLVVPRGRRLQHEVALLTGGNRELLRRVHQQVAVIRGLEWRIERLHPLLVSWRQTTGRLKTRLVLLRPMNQPGFEWIVHHRVGVPGGTLHTIGWNLADDVVERLLARPVVRRPTQGLVDRFLVPDDTGVWILMLVRKPERVPDFVAGDVDAVLAAGDAIGWIQIQRSIVRALIEHLAADIGPVTIIRLESHAHFGRAAIRDLLEAEADAEIRPPLERLSNLVAKGIGSRPRLEGAGMLEEREFDRGPVDPLVPVQDNQPGAFAANRWREGPWRSFPQCAEARSRAGDRLLSRTS